MNLPTSVRSAGGRLRALWWRVSGGMWFVPGVIVLGAVLLALLLIGNGDYFAIDFEKRWPRLFGAAPEGTRGMLSAIAGSMITVAGVVFSVTLVALSLAASQYSSRVLRTFMADRPTQVVLGVFVGIFAYCLVVLRTIRGGEDPFVPALAVFGAMVLAFVGIGFLVFFIHHLAAAIQASTILARVAGGTLEVVDELFPEELGAPLEEANDALRAQHAGPWTPVLARQSGYIISIDSEALLACARECGRVVRMERGIGEFVVHGQPLASLEGDQPVGEAQEKALNGCFSFDTERTLEQDAAFGVHQIVALGVKALSPGINDSATALMCIDRVTEIMVHLARRRIETAFRRDGGRLRVIALGPTFESLVLLGYEELREEARGKRAILGKLIHSLEQVTAATADPHRREVLARQVHGLVEDCVEQPDLRERARRLLGSLERDARRPIPIREKESSC